MNEKHLNYEKNPSDFSTTSNGSPVEVQQSSIDVKMGQLEVSVASLKEKADGDYSKLSQKVDSSLELRKWILTTIVGIIVAILGVIYFITTFANSNITSYKELQNDYYKQLLENQKQVTDLKICLSSNRWLNPKCFEN